MLASVPGKIFLLGEYAVLKGLPAYIASIGPRFVLTKESSPSSVSVATFHAKSPAGLLRRSMESIEHTDLFFKDPWRGTGGFGASTAQFILYYTYSKREPEFDWRKAWAVYRSLQLKTSSQNTLPSGADLIIQSLGGVREVTLPISDDQSDQESLSHKIKILDLSPQLDWDSVLVFSASHLSGRKVATHSHLDSLSTSIDFSSLLPVLEEARGALQSSDFESFSLALTHYAESLRALGLESEAAHQDRKELLKVPGVLGVKGAGALLSDAVLVAISRDADRELIVLKAKQRGLRLLEKSIIGERGLEQKK